MASSAEKSFYSPTEEAVFRPTCIQQIKTRFRLVAILVLACCLAIWFRKDNSLNRSKIQLCPQVDVLAPEAHRGLWTMLNAKISSPEFHARAVDWLAGAVRIP
jgi:hypothetical protein